MYKVENINQRLEISIFMKKVRETETSIGNKSNKYDTEFLRTINEKMDFGNENIQWLYCFINPDDNNHNPSPPLQVLII